MRKCPICGKELEDYLRKCSNCDSYISKIRRFFDGLRFYFEPLTFMAAIIVLGVMIWSNLQMKDSIKLTKKIVEQGEQNLKLFKASVDKIDTGFALQRKQIELGERGVTVEETKKEIALKESIEKNRPRIKIFPPKVVISDSGFLWIYTDVKNEGLSDAESVLIAITYQYPLLSKERKTETYPLDKIPNNTRLTMPYCIKTDPNGDFYSFIDVRYTWLEYKKIYRDKKYYHYIFDRNNSKFSTKLMDETESSKFWK